MAGLPTAKVSSLRYAVTQRLGGGSDPRSCVVFIARGGEARFVTVRPPLLDESWLGLTLDAVALQRLQAIGADPCGEFGEYHTVVTGCPAFSSPLTLEPGQRVLSGGCWALDFDVSS